MSAPPPIRVHFRSGEEPREGLLVYYHSCPKLLGAFLIPGREERCADCGRSFKRKRRKKGGRA